MEISPSLVGILSFVLLFVLILVVKMPIFFAFVLTGFLGYLCLGNFEVASSNLVGSVWTTCTNYTLLAIPLFLIMGQFSSYSGIGSDLYDSASKWFGRLPGGLAIATVWGCGGFAACTGASVTGILTFGPIAYKPMLELGYDKRLTLGVLCSGATVGVMIPPSMSFILYGVITEESVGQLFMAGIIPGILEVVLYSAAIILVIGLGIFAAPRGSRHSWKERIISLKGIWGMLLLMVLVLGGIYGGIFTPTEAGAIGAIGSLIIWLARKGFSWANFRGVLTEGLSLTCMAYAVIAGGMYFANFIGLTRLNYLLIDVLTNWAAPPLAIIALFLAVFLVLGCVMPPLSVLVLALPFLYPFFTEVLGFSGIWLGVLCVAMTELACITPPVGLNLFVTQGFAGKGASLGDIYRGVVPFIIADAIRLVILVAFPILSLWLPSMMFQVR